MESITIVAILGITVALLIIIHNRIPTKYKSLLDISKILMLFTLAYFTLGVTSLLGPAFFRLMNYDVIGYYSITTTDASSLFLDSLLTIVVGYFLIDTKNNDNKGDDTEK
jgi:hypothetical protein